MSLCNASKRPWNYAFRLCLHYFFWAIPNWCKFDVIPNWCYLDVACKKSILKNFAKFTRKFTGVSVLMNFRLYASNFIKKRLWHRCFPVNFGKLLKFSYFIERQRTAASENWDLIFLLILKLGMTHWWKHSSKNS